MSRSKGRPSRSTVFVAVHGIGDQVRNETIQRVATRVFSNEGKVAALPLGAFPSVDTESYEPLFPGLATARFGEVGFAEVYWAEVTRQIATAGYTLEESKRWGRTIVRRIQKRTGTRLDLMEQVLDEMIDTLAVLDRLLNLARVANLGRFDLKNLLDQFLGDAQFFIEFESVRSEIVTVFNTVMERVRASRPEARIVLVAHSEGTVVAFMGLLLAAAGKDASGKSPAPKPAWLDNIEAVMTLGSPIDKHLILWPELWKDVEDPKHLPEKPIFWRNYYDNGDPIGGELDQTEAWLERHGYSRLFDSKRVPGFTRSYFPGKAHVEYWSDDEVFSHFLNAMPPTAPTDRPKPPRTRPFAVVCSYLAPYAVAAAVLFLAVYALAKGANQWRFANAADLNNLLGYTSLLAGLTVFARIPRLVRTWWRWVVGGLAFAASAVGYYFAVVKPAEGRIEDCELQRFLLWDWKLILVALAVAVVATLIGLRWPRSGMKALVIAGSLAAVGLVGLVQYSAQTQDDNAQTQEERCQPVEDAEARTRGETQRLEPVRIQHAKDGSFWPVLVGGAFFLYLWWFAALIFDLVFVWHRNIRHGAGERILAELMPPE